MNFSFANQEFIADPAGVLFWPARQTLIVADLHLEKGSAFGTRGQFLPPYDSAETVAKLRRLVAQYGAARVLTLGDNIHDLGGWERLDNQTYAQLSALVDDVDLLFLYGNHDRLQIPPLGTAQATLIEEGMLFTHEPALYDLPTMAGHLHPCATLQTAAGRHRMCCFYVSPQLLILPAFGAYAGGMDVLTPPFQPLHDAAAQLLLCGTQAVHQIDFTAYGRAAGLLRRKA